MPNQPQEFVLEGTTVWSFPERGKWATHGNNAKFRGNWPPQIPRNLILRYTQEGDTVLDPMVGSGTTMIECKLLGRNGLGLDINPKHIEITRKNLDFDGSNVGKIRLNVADARNMQDIVKDNSVDLIATHPPYANIISYSEDLEGDISSISSIDKFCDQMEKIASECFRILKSDKYCAILMGDTRRKRHQIALAYMTMQRFLNVGFVLKEDIIKLQWNCKTTREKWYSGKNLRDFMLIMHEHLFILRKP